MKSDTPFWKIFGVALVWLESNYTYQNTYVFRTDKPVGHSLRLSPRLEESTLMKKTKNP